MTRIRVPLGKFIKEYSERNKGNEDIPVYSVTNSQGEGVKFSVSMGKILL